MLTKYNKKRLNQHQQAALMDVAGLMSILHSESLTELEPLLKLVPGGKRDLGLLKAKAAKLFDDLLLVTPTDTLYAMRNSLKRIRCRIGVPLIGGENANAEMGWVVSFDDLTTLTNACYDKCMLCDRTGGEISKCKLRKTFQNLPSPDEPEPMGTGCGYRRIIMQGNNDYQAGA